ncbi:MAG: serine/threonine protein kinase [Acidobacteria bacterium]|nr:MAG: serine/threonine protein kinase [Acidobacteriota bacterium]
MLNKKFKLAVADVVVGAVVSLLVLAAFYMQWGESMELKLYDMRAKLRARARAGEAVVLVGIDDQSIREIGRWPWPRSYMAEMVNQLAEAQAKVIGIDVLMNEKELNPGLDEIRTIRQAYANQTIDAKPGDAKQAAAATATLVAGQQFVRILDDAEKKLDNDIRLADSLALAQNAVMPMYFVVGEGNSSKQPPEAVVKNFVSGVKSDGSVTPATDFVAPYDLFAKNLKAIGQINLSTSPDGVERAIPLVVDYNGRLFPSFALQALRAYYGLESDDYRFVPGRELVLGKAHIPVDANGRLLVNYVSRETFPRYGFSDIRNKKVPLENLQNKIVLIGMMATGAGDLHITPVGDLFPGVEIQGNVINSVLQNSYLIRPAWAQTLELGVMLLFALFVSLAIPHLSAGKSAILASVLLVVTVAGGIYAFTSYGYWLKIFYPSLMLVAGYIVVISKRYLLTERQKERLEGESVETNKMLGLSFQGQGMLDMAFEKFRKCPVDEGMKDTLYNLALDFERKRQFNKAVSVFEHIMTVDKNFRDISVRMDKLRVASETVILGTAGLKKGTEATVMIQGGVSDLARPTLGRYEVMKELGKGAMGVVYLGKDPKINREVAIKTLRFEDEFDAGDMKGMKERFFREAESAGRLVHPNIVTIYDAGEDGDISYIAMELLNGTDLKQHTTKGKLLPVSETLEVIAKVADALDYAHSQNVVHRDIKPANIMKLKNSEIKVTDFGIARITSQSKTATGTVMGTPAYMAPEQLAGKKVDGRADLFSLGVTMYELLTGEKPFIGESVATLMFRIANEPHAPVLSMRADLPLALNDIVNRALQKDPEKRYQRGSELAADIRSLSQAVAATA